MIYITFLIAWIWMQTIIDAHAHIFPGFRPADLGGKTNIITVLNSTSLMDFDKVLTTSAEFRQETRCFLGLHPNEDSLQLSVITSKIVEHSASIDGIGEIGLDSRLFSPAQLESFRNQLELAERLAKPVSVHSRGMVSAVLQELMSYRVKGVLLHWFAGSEGELKKATDNGFFVSFGPPVVYSKRLRRLSKACPSDFLLTESDSPVRYGACFENRSADPRFVASVVFALSQIRGETPAQLEQEVESNFKRFISGN
jgi:TatD DNase family protein